MTSPLILSSFKLSRSTFEIRYNNAYALWDKAGIIWTTADKKWSQLKMINAEPAVTSFRLEDRYELSVKLDRTSIIDFKPTSKLKGFLENAKQFIDIVVNCLELDMIERLGFRIIYALPSSDKSAASNVIADANIMNIPKGKCFNIEGQPLLPEYSIVWEGNSLGARIKILAQEKEINLDVNPAIKEIDSYHEKISEVLLDIDYYTLKPILTGQLDVNEWISQAYHVIKRDAHVFLGG